MPKSKRAKVYSMTNVSKRIPERKEKLVSDIREWVSEYKYLFVFSVENMRNNKLKELRAKFASSRFLMGKKKVMRVALGIDEASEIKPDIHNVTKLLEGEVGLFFTNELKETVIEYFTDHKETDFARAGFIPIETISRSAGPIESLPGPLEPTLRSLGMRTSLRNGIIHLDVEHTLCTAGEPITPEQAKVLKYFDIKLADFHVNLKCVYEEGNFQFIGPQSTLMMREDEDDQDQDQDEE